MYENIASVGHSKGQGHTSKDSSFILVFKLDSQNDLMTGFFIWAFGFTIQMHSGNNIIYLLYYKRIIGQLTGYILQRCWPNWLQMWDSVWLSVKVTWYLGFIEIKT